MNPPIRSGERAAHYLTRVTGYRALREKQRPMIRSIRTLRIRQLTGFDLSMFVPTSPLRIHCGSPQPFSWNFAGVSPPGQLRHYWPFDEKLSTDKTTLAQNELQLAKRKRTLLESNPPRNSQPETHRDDEARGGASAAPGPFDFHRIDRFPDA